MLINHRLSIGLSLLFENWYADQNNQPVRRIHTRYRPIHQDGKDFKTKDPYLQITIGAETQKSTVLNGAGKTPKWPDILCFSSQGNIMRVVVKDEDVGSDDLVGQGRFDISQAYSHPHQPGTFAVEVFYELKSAGKLTMTMMYLP